MNDMGVVGGAGCGESILCFAADSLYMLEMDS